MFLGVCVAAILPTCSHEECLKVDSFPDLSVDFLNIYYAITLVLLLRKIHGPSDIYFKTGC